MKRFRLSTLMLLVMVAALTMGLLLQEMRYRRREAEQQSKLTTMEKLHEIEISLLKFDMNNLKYKLDTQNSLTPNGGAGDGK